MRKTVCMMGALAAMILASQVATAGLSIDPGYTAPDETLVGVRYKSFANTGSGELYLGKPDLGVGSNRTERNINWAQGNNAFTMTVDIANDKLTTNVTNANGSYDLEYLDVASKLTGSLGLADINVLQVTVADRDQGTQSNVDLLGLTVDGMSAGDFTATGWNDWMVSGFSAGSSIVLSGNIYLDGPFSNSSEKSRIELKFGANANVIPEPTAVLLGVLGLSGLAVARRRMA